MGGWVGQLGWVGGLSGPEAAPQGPPAPPPPLLSKGLPPPQSCHQHHYSLHTVADSTISSANRSANTPCGLEVHLAQNCLDANNEAGTTTQGCMFRKNNFWDTYSQTLPHWLPLQSPWSNRKRHGVGKRKAFPRNCWLLLSLSVCCWHKCKVCCHIAHACVASLLMLQNIAQLYLQPLEEGCLSLFSRGLSPYAEGT